MVDEKNNALLLEEEVAEEEEETGEEEETKNENTSNSDQKVMVRAASAELRDNGISDIYSGTTLKLFTGGYGNGVYISQNLGVYTEKGYIDDFNNFTQGQNFGCKPKILQKVSEFQPGSASEIEENIVLSSSLINIIGNDRIINYSPNKIINESAVIINSAAGDSIINYVANSFQIDSSSGGTMSFGGGKWAVQNVGPDAQSGIYARFA